MKIRPQNRKALLRAALGEEPSELLIRNAKLVNVLTGEIYPADVYASGGFIVHVESARPGENPAPAQTVIDAAGSYLLPGFIDSHEHIESSMMTPRHFAETVIPQGTTTVICDPHEIANVLGEEGVRYMHECGEGLPMRQLIDVPSCVPSAPGLEGSGASFGAAEIRELAQLDRAVGLAEVMDFPGVIGGAPRMMEILDAAEEAGLYLQGHAPMLSGRALSAYRCAGPNTCHETCFAAEALEKLRCGVYVDARESSIMKNVKEIWEGVRHVRYFDQLTFCTDDREADEILGEGHVNDVVRAAIACGMDPVDAVKCATYNAAREAGLENLGAIAPGFAADMQLVPDLRELRPSHVFFGGRLVAKDGALIEPLPEKRFPTETRSTMHVRPLTVQDFCLRAPVENGSVAVNVMRYPSVESALSTLAQETLPVRGGCVETDDPELLYMAVINRHEGSDAIAVGLVRGAGLRGGALASTVAHDCHNLIVVYDTPENALLAANELIACGGGMCAVRGGKVLHTLALPLAGLMSLSPARELAQDCRAMKDAVRSLGLTQLANPLLRIVTFALPVIPEVRLTDLGLVDVASQKLIPTFPDFS